MHEQINMINIKCNSQARVTYLSVPNTFMERKSFKFSIVSNIGFRWYSIGVEMGFTSIILVPLRILTIYFFEIESTVKVCDCSTSTRKKYWIFGTLRENHWLEKIIILWMISLQFPITNIRLHKPENSPLNFVDTWDWPRLNELVKLG